MENADLDQVSGRQPDFLVIGGMRCGSTTLHNVLSAHPQLFLPAEKELHYYDGYNPELFGNNAAYLQLFNAAKKTQLCGEVTPDYLTTPSAFETISATFKTLKTIVILRDPVERLCSHYRMSYAAGFEVLPFSQAIEIESERLNERDQIADIFHSYIERSSYYSHIKKYSDRFGRSNMHIMFLEELNEQPLATLTKLWEFLGVNELKYDDFQTLTQPSNTSENLLLAKQNILSRIKARLLSPLKSGRKLDINAAHISSEQKINIRQQFERPNEQLANFLGRELPFKKH